MSTQTSKFSPQYSPSEPYSNSLEQSQRGVKQAKPLEYHYYSTPGELPEYHYLDLQLGLDNIEELQHLLGLAQLEEESPHAHHSPQISQTVTSSYSSSYKHKQNQKKRVLITFTLPHNIGVEKKGNSIVLQRLAHRYVATHTDGQDYTRHDLMRLFDS